MLRWLRRTFTRGYERLLRREIGDCPTHVAIIQDGNRRFAREHGSDPTNGHQAGAQTTERVIEWCGELGIEELTLYAFSTENFDRPPNERESLFDLIESKLYDFAEDDQIHENQVCIRAIGELDRLPDRVLDAVQYAERQTRGYGGLTLNVALAYGGRNELLGAARDVATAVDAGDLDPEDVDVAEVERRLYRQSVRDVDLIIRTGGDERTSNFLPWHANGNEAAVYFCAPYWPEFSKIDLLRGLRTYEAREKSWQRTRTERAVALVRVVAETEFEDARTVAGRLTQQLTSGGAEELSEELARQAPETAD